MHQKHIQRHQESKPISKIIQETFFITSKISVFNTNKHGLLVKIYLTHYFVLKILYTNSISYNQYSKTLKFHTWII
jgi:hypothetical protein